MEMSMKRPWSITADWENLDEGSPEERACFAALGIQASDIWFTEGRDAIANRLRRAPLLSAYHLAEWFAWNWWRLRWEPRASSPDWDLAHKVANIGNGYIWPNVTIFSDGERTALISRATTERAETPFRYITDAATILQSNDFESEVDEFIEQVLERLDSADIEESNLSKLWIDISAERADPEVARVRKLEALMGKNPDELDEELTSVLTADSKKLGFAAVNEIAADFGQGRDAKVLTSVAIIDLARRAGFSAKPADMVRLASALALTPSRGQVPAWRLGAMAAKALRDQEGLGDSPLSDAQLLTFLATDAKAISAPVAGGSGVSFLLKEAQGASVVLRSRWKTGWRFEVARLLGVTLLDSEDHLFPATRAHTYRQKAQRSFAAELLSPFLAVSNMLQGDFSQEAQLDVAEYFGVSEITVRTQLVNHKVLDREELDPEYMFAAA